MGYQLFPIVLTFAYAELIKHLTFTANSNMRVRSGTHIEDWFYCQLTVAKYSKTERIRLHLHLLIIGVLVTNSRPNRKPVAFYDVNFDVSRPRTAIFKKKSKKKCKLVKKSRSWQKKALFKACCQMFLLLNSVFNVQFCAF